MNDDERLAALFRDAASDAPPPAFDHDDVVSASRRITARRRSAAVAAAAVIGLVGLGAAVAWPGSDEALTSAAAPAPASAPGPVSAPDARDGPGSAELSEPYAAERSGEDADSGSAAGGSGLPVVPAPVPAGPGAAACADEQDPVLRALVVEVLPDAAGDPPFVLDSRDCRPGTERYLELQVGGAEPGVLSVAYLPPGTAAQEASASGALVAPTASGGTVLVSSTPDGPGPAPYADRLPELVDHLAARL
jgi:hypothetical protein